MVNSPQPASTMRYLVLESRHQKTMLRGLYGATEDPRWIYLFADTEWQAYLKESPILLEVEQDSADYGWALKGLKEDSLSGLILGSSKGLDAVSSWLRERLTVRFDSQRQGLLRFYDPWIWHQLVPRTNPAAEVIEQAIYWYGEPGQQRWLTIESPEPIAMSPVPTLDEQQWLALNATSV